MSWVRLIAAASLCAAILAAPPATHAAGPAYLPFAVPDSTATYPMGLNDTFTITGYYLDQRGATHGFVRSFNGVITTFDVPGSVLTRPTGINDSGEITGYYEVADGLSNLPLGFLRAADGAITTFGSTTTVPSIETQPDAINAAGTVIGNFPSVALGSTAFLRSSGGAVQRFTLSFGASYSTFLTGLNAGGAVVGYASSDSIAQAFGFLWSGQGTTPSPGQGYTAITVPGSTGTFPTGINAAGDIVGCYIMNGVYHDFVRASNGTFTTIHVTGTVPPCVATVDQSDLEVYNLLPAQVLMNNSGMMTGTTTNGGVTSAFVRSASGTLSAFAIAGSTATVPTALNNLDVLTGYYTQDNTTQGFLALPVTNLAAPVGAAPRRLPLDAHSSQ